MHSINCIDEIAINASKDKVFNIVKDYPNWKQWIPIYKCYLLNSTDIKEGSEIHHQYGYKPIILSNFVRRIEKIDTGNKIEETYISGGLIGNGSWHFTEKDGVTIAAYHCQVTANNTINNILFKIMGEKAHKNVYKPLLLKLKNYCER